MLISRLELNVEVQKCYTTMGRIPTEEISYSDHEALLAVFSVVKGKDLSKFLQVSF